MKLVLCKNLFDQKVWVTRDSAGAFRRHGGFDIPALCLIEYLASKFSGAIAADIGANIGNHTVVLAKFCARVMCFEPRLNIEDTLRKNVDQNGLTNCTLVAAGLSDKADVAPLYLGDNAEGGSTTFVHGLTSGNRKSIDVPLLIGDEYFSEIGVDRLDIVKLDVEGMEANVVMGMAHTIEKFQPIFLMEWNNDVTRRAFAEKLIFDTIFKGYTLIGVRSKDARELFPKNALGWISRKFARIINARGFVAVPFEVEKNFETLVLVPRAKLKMLERLSIML